MYAKLIDCAVVNEMRGEFYWWTRRHVSELSQPLTSEAHMKHLLALIVADEYCPGQTFGKILMKLDHHIRFHPSFFTTNHFKGLE
jgi:hypothetical protein